MGIAQAIAIIPGVSRSGSTLATGLLLKVSPQEAPRFSFLMVLPLILAATLLEVKDLLEAPAGEHALAVGPLVVGFLSSFLFGILACLWMIRLVRRSKLYHFGWYCLAVGSIAVGASLLGYA
jgi:Uncharacterized bacitracin resistance protein